jgi:parallel beta-helix repeat protein
MVLILSLFLIGEVRAATYYVAPNGNDSNSGSINAPFKTIQKAANIVNPGDIVIVKDGTYTATDNNDYIVKLDRGGTSDDWITFRAENKWGAKLNGQNNTTGYGWSFESDARYIRVEGFEIYGTHSKGFLSNAAGNNIYLYRNKIYDIGKWCTGTDYGQNGIYIGSGTSYHTAESNIIYNVGRLPNCGGNDYWQNHDHGIYIKNSSNHTIINNIFYNNTAGWAIHMYGGTQSKIKIINNTFALPNPDRDGHILITSDTIDVIIQNNIFYSPRNYAVNGVSMGTSISMKNNLVYGASISDNCDGTHGICSNNITGQDPKFVDSGKRNFHLQSGSPAIDKGLVFSGRIKDADGNSIVGAPDIGAYEAGGVTEDTTPPAPPAIIEVK